MTDRTPFQTANHSPSMGRGELMVRALTVLIVALIAVAWVGPMGLLVAPPMLLSTVLVAAVARAQRADRLALQSADNVVVLSSFAAARQAQQALPVRQRAASR